MYFYVKYAINLNLIFMYACPVLVKIIGNQDLMYAKNVMYKERANTPCKNRMKNRKKNLN